MTTYGRTSATADFRAGVNLPAYPGRPHIALVSLLIVSTVSASSASSGPARPALDDGRSHEYDLDSLD